VLLCIIIVMYDLVVSHYKEDLSWLPSLVAANAGAIDRVFLYCKGGDGDDGDDCPTAEEISSNGIGAASPAQAKSDPREEPPTIAVRRVPNVGREAETYVRHMCEHYSDPRGNHTVFLQGDPRGHLAADVAGVRDCSLPDPREVPTFRAFFAPPTLEERHVWDLEETPWNMPVFRKAHQLFVLPTDCDATFLARFSPGAQYVVSPAAIRARPRAFYEELLRQMHFVDRNVDAWFAFNWRSENYENIPHIMDAWTMERLWPLLFDPEVPARHHP
jgi:hypothetical protein